jgi:hypothetical protein
MRNLSNWRSVRLWERAIERDLRERHWLWLHGWCIGLFIVGLMWATSHLQMLMGSQSLALRYLVTLGIGYLGYLLVLRLWAGVMVGREPNPLDGLDLPLPGPGSSVDVPIPRGIDAGGGGDFGGGGASGDFSGSSEAADALADVAGNALGVAASADEGAVVAVPVVAIFLIALAVIFGAGTLVFMYFGSEALLAVAVELAFGYVSARTAIRVVREGWLSAVIRLTWKPLLGAIFCAVVLGATIDYFIPTAHSLPHAVKLIKASR